MAIATTTHQQKTFFFMFENKSELQQWVLILAGLQSLNVNKSLLSSTEKVG
jgi:hypothetical protein